MRLITNNNSTLSIMKYKELVSLNSYGDIHFHATLSSIKCFSRGELVYFIIHHGRDFVKLSKDFQYR